jgi:hypothetical protein
MSCSTHQWYKDKFGAAFEEKSTSSLFPLNPLKFIQICVNPKNW